MHLLALISNEKEKRSDTYVNKLVSEFVIGCYFYLLSKLYDLLWRSYDEVTPKLWRCYD